MAHTSEPKEQDLSHLGLMTPSMQQRVENMRLKTLESAAGVSMTQLPWESSDKA